MPWIAAGIGAVGAIGSAFASKPKQGKGLNPFDVGTMLGTAHVTPQGIWSNGGLGSEQGTKFNDQTGQLLDQFGSAPSGQFNFDPNSLVGAGTDTTAGDPFMDAAHGALSAGSDILSAFKSFDPNAFAQTQFDRLTALAAPGEDTAARKTATQLFQRGRAGANDTHAGQVFRDLDKSQQDAATQRALASIGLAGDEQTRLASTGIGISNLGANLGTTAEGVNSSTLARLLAAVTGGAGVGQAQQNYKSGVLNQAITTQAGVTNAGAGEQTAIQTALAGATGQTTAQNQQTQIGATAGAAQGDILGSITGSLIQGIMPPKK